jgi:hypothetical protein
MIETPEKGVISGSSLGGLNPDNSDVHTQIVSVHTPFSPWLTKCNERYAVVVGSILIAPNTVGQSLSDSVEEASGVNEFEQILLAGYANYTQQVERTRGASKKKVSPSDSMRTISGGGIWRSNHRALIRRRKLEDQLRGKNQESGTCVLLTGGNNRYSLQRAAVLSFRRLRRPALVSTANTILQPQHYRNPRKREVRR